MGVPQNDPKWMVYLLEDPIKMDDFGVPHDLGTPYMYNHIFDIVLHIDGLDLD